MADITSQASDWSTALSWHSITNANTVTSTAIDLNSGRTGSWDLWARFELGRTNTTAFTNSYPVFVVEGTDDAVTPVWRELWRGFAAPGATIGSSTFNGAVSAAATSITLAATTDFVANQLIFLGDASTANYEVVRAAAISSPNITLETPTQFSHSNGASCTAQAERALICISVSGVKQARLAIYNFGGQTVNASAEYAIVEKIVST